MHDEINISHIIQEVLRSLPYGMSVEEILEAAIEKVCEATELSLHDHEIAEIFTEVIKPEVRGEVREEVKIVPKINVDMLAAVLQTKFELSRMRRA